MIEKIEQTDWAVAKRDAVNFLRERESESLELLGKDFFIAMVNKFSEIADWFVIRVFGNDGVPYRKILELFCLKT